MRDRRGAFALVLALACVACRKSPVAELVEAERNRGGGGHVPEQAIGSGTDPSTGLPVGYPPSLPMLQGARALSGGVDPGVVRTSTLVFEGRSVSEVEAELRSALTAHGQRIVDVFAPADGSKQFRIDLGEQYATVILSDDHGRVRMDTTAIDRRRPSR